MPLPHFTEPLRWLLLETGIHGNIKCFERSAVLRDSMDYTQRGLFSWSYSIWKTDVLGAKLKVVEVSILKQSRPQSNLRNIGKRCTQDKDMKEL